jgi:hypothetical protein
MQPGFAAGFGNELPNATAIQQRLMEGRVRLQQQAQQQQAAEAFFKSLVTPDAAAIPQQGPPGMGQAPPPGTMTQGAGPVPPSTGQVPGMPPGGGAPSPAPAPPVPGPAGGSPSPATAAGGLQLPDPLVRLRAMAQALKAANPHADNATLAEALDRQIATVKGLAPEDKALMQAQIALMNAQARYYAVDRNNDTRRDIADRAADTRLTVADRTNSTRRDIASQTNQTRRDVAGETNDTRRDIAGETNQTRRDVAGQAEAGRNARAGAAEAGRNSRAAARIDASKADAGVKAQYKSLMAQRAEIKDKIAAFQNGTPGAPKKEEVAQLQGKLQQLDSQVSALWSRNPNLPRPSELDREPGGAAPSPAAATTAPAAGGIPEGAPTATDAQGNKVYWDGKAWLPAPKG